MMNKQIAFVPWFSKISFNKLFSEKAVKYSTVSQIHCLVKLKLHTYLLSQVRKSWNRGFWRALHTQNNVVECLYVCVHVNAHVCVYVFGEFDRGKINKKCKAEHWRIDAFELWCWRRLLRVHWTARRSNQSILKEISPGIWKEWC